MLDASPPTPPPPPPPLRLGGVVGREGRCNDVVYCQPGDTGTAASTVVYFGGDMQDFTERMRTHRDGRDYLRWNLEDTARALRDSFPRSHVVVVRPAKIEYKTFSCFKHFVPCNSCGTPEHGPMHFALQHLETLLQQASARLRRRHEAPAADLRLDRHRLTLVGFSKGCVVLNQFLYEFHYLNTLAPDDRASMAFVGRIADMYWLDGGHSGGKNTWITSRPLLETLAGLGIGVHVHVTPYQIRDERRPCIRKEEKLFGDQLRRLGAPFQRTVHFESMPPSLHMHFNLINVFRLGAEDAR